MFRDLFQREKKKTPLDEEIERVLNDLKNTDPDDEKYQKKLDYLSKLNEVRTKSAGTPLSRDTLFTVAGNLLGILLIIGYERHNVLVSKGLNHLVRPR